MRVALAHPTYWPEVRRGAERLVHELSAGLHRRGHSVRVVTTHPGPRSETVEDGVVVVRSRRPPGPSGRRERIGHEPHLAQAPLTYRALADADVAEALQVGDALACSASGRPSVFHLMGIPDEATLAGRRGRATLVRLAARRCDAVVVLSEAAAVACRRTLGVEPRTIAPGVDLGAFALGTERTGDPTVVCAADAREPRKGVAELVAALPSVRTKHPGTRLLLDARTGRAFAHAPGVELVAMDDRAALARLLGRAWAAALPARGEAFGLVLAEALATGTPVVGRDEGGIREVVGEAGRLFATDGGLAGALSETLELARTGGGQLRAACRAQAEAFSTDRCAAAHEALYEELLARA